MSRQTAVKKAERVVGFLMALRNPKIASIMASRGFRTDDLEEGFALLRKAAPASIAEPSPGAAMDETPHQAVSRWSRTWLPIATIVLRRRAPELGSRLLEGLPDEPLLAAAIFLDRLDSLQAPKRKATKSDPGSQALALLATRGLTAEVLAEGREAVELAKSAKAASPNEWDDDAFAKADEELWSYYLEWSLVARLAIKEKRLLRQLGFRPSSAKADEGGDPTE